MTVRPYAQLCALATSLDIIGDRWSLLVVRELLLGPKRFTDLVAGLPGAGTNTLTTRLKDLETHGVITRRILPPPAGVTVYELTARGRGLEPAVLELVRWGAPLIGTVPIEHPLHAEWLGLAMRAFFRPGPPDGVFELTMPSGTITAAITAGALQMRAGPAPTPCTASVRGTEDGLLATLLGRLRLTDGLASGALHATGDTAALDTLLRACAIRP